MFRSVGFVGTNSGYLTSQIKNNAISKDKPSELIIKIAFIFVFCCKNGVTVATVKKDDKLNREFRRPQLIASPIFGVNPTSSS